MIEKQQTADRKRTRALVVGAVSLLLISGGVLSALYYQSVQSDRGNYPVSQPQLSQAQLEERLGTVQVLRERWRPWAMQHKPLLKKMLSSQANDDMALQFVYAALPGDISSAGITDADLNGGKIEYSWHLLDKVVRPGVEPGAPARTEDETKEIEKEKRIAQQDIKEDFAALRDVELSDSVNAGPSSLSLWASGRITETTYVHNTKAKKGDPLFVKERRQISPPFEFLK